MEVASKRKRKETPNVLLGVSGSVAAVKAPEIALKLVQDLHANVCVLLTRGGLNFWEKAKDYNREIWDEMQSLSPTKRPQMSENDGSEEPSTLSVVGKIPGSHWPC